MSLIQEALKRKLEEQQGGPTPAVSPPPPPPRSAGPSKGGAFGRILGFLFLILLLLSISVALFYLAARKWNWKDALAEAKSDAGQAQAKWEKAMEKTRSSAPAPSEEPVASTPRPTSTSAPDLAATVAPAASPLASVSERVHSMKDKVLANHAEQAELVAGEPAAPVAKPAPETPASTPEPVQVLSRGATAGHGDPEPAPRAAKGVSWPSITVNGILASGKQGGGSAIVNNRMVGANEMIEGARVLEVQSRGVMMEYKGETRLLLIGQTAD